MWEGLTKGKSFTAVFFQFVHTVSPWLQALTVLAGILWGIKLVFLLRMLVLFKIQLSQTKNVLISSSSKLLNIECLHNFETFSFSLIPNDMLIFLHQYRSSKTFNVSLGKHIVTNKDIQIRMIFKPFTSRHLQDERRFNK